MPVSIADFLALRDTQPVVDVRSGAEFEAGHIRGAFNIPILNNEERKIVGTAFSRSGQREAIREGFRLVGPRLSEIIEAAEKVSDGREVLVHCWRGGMRSENFCQFLKMGGIRSNALIGGYKAYRQHALTAFRKKIPIVLLTGLTGAGKTEVLKALASRGEQIIDLENLARHKGSAFGGLMMPEQPSTEQFQNELFEEIQRLDLSRRVWVEDESLAIGKIFLPVEFFNTMKAGSLVQLVVAKENRVRRLVEEYGGADRSEFLIIMGKIVKKLGGQHYKSASEALLKGDMASAIDILLTYYDKAYQESIAKRKEKVISTVEWDGSDRERLVDELIHGTSC